MKKNFPLSNHNLVNVYKTLSLLVTLVFLIMLLFSINVNAQCPPGVQCDFLTKKGTLTSTNGAEISAFDPVSQRVYTVAGAVIEYQIMSNTGALTFGGNLPFGFT